ncbi:unnamed protein product, partial [Phaeothamnion confervicola]
MATTDEEAQVAADAALALTFENPYLAVVSKRLRGLRKKLEKIRKNEALAGTGKLNEEQKQLLSSRGEVERAIKEADQLRTQLEEVAQKEVEDQAARDEELAKATAAAPSLLPPPPPPPPPEHAETQTESKERPTADAQVATDLDGPAAEAALAAATALPPLNTNAQMQTAAAAAATTAAPPSSAPLAAATSKAAIAAAAAEAVRAALERLLRLLHVVQRSEGAGIAVPSEVSFLAKVLLGKTVPPELAGFLTCLERSVEAATAYCDDGAAARARTVVHGVTNGDIESAVAGLCASLLAHEVPAPAAPEFNFFADVALTPLPPPPASAGTTGAAATGAAAAAAPSGAAPAPVARTARAIGGVVTAPKAAAVATVPTAAVAAPASADGAEAAGASAKGGSRAAAPKLQR